MEVDKDTKIRKRLVLDSWWHCSQTHNCSKCPVADKCRKLLDNFDESLFSDGDKVEELLSRFHRLREMVPSLK